ncbi:hypothetical protein DPMN_063190 [Dreissena polymorpha]|uniref:Uncharacterized protein n=1 Tax=Dreissena polymorpha TaxID=45954 RepID=A0A9D4CA22_DREPO|nr:hypothetical protein DPMN_063190 [Dreissena polymorpha]
MLVRFLGAIADSRYIGQRDITDLYSNVETIPPHRLSPSAVSKEAVDRLLLGRWYAMPSENDDVDTVQGSDDMASSQPQYYQQQQPQLVTTAKSQQGVFEEIQDLGDQILEEHKLKALNELQLCQIVISDEVNSNLAAESGECSSDDFEEIFIERNQKKSKSYHQTLLAPKRDCLAKPRFAEKTMLRGNWTKRRKKKAKTLEKDKTEYLLPESNLASCMNLEPSDNDHFLYCGECNKEFEGDCPVHGPYNFIKGKEVPEGDPCRADHTLPDDLEIKTSKIFGAGLGVFSKVRLESRIMFGPYRGDTISDNHKSGYCWQIYKEGKASHCVDAQNKATSNWMRCINCAMTEADQNLVAFQYKGGIYYCTFKPVSPEEELLVYYGDEYARKLGINRDKNLLFRPKYVNGEKSDILQTVMEKHLKNAKLQKKNIENKDEKEYNGEMWNNISNNRSHLKTQMRIHAGEKLYKCGVCSYECNQSGSLKSHMRIHTGEKPYKCEVCGFECSQGGSLKRHMRIHTGDKPYKCESSHMKTHMKIHAEGRLYKCESSSLKRHMRIHAGERLYKCEVCGYESNRSFTLKTHMMIHTGEKPYKCESSHMKTHMKIHSEERPFKCEVCGYTCKLRSSLKTHMRIHSEERVYECGMCCYTCKLSSNMKTHMMIHTEEKLYKCEVCGYEFNQSTNLKRHMRIHTGERRHMRIHTGERLYKCETESLKRHMRIHAD